MQRGVSLMSKLAGKPKYEDEQGNRKWIHQDKQLIDNFVIYQAKYLGCTTVDSPRGIDVVKDAIKKIQFQQEVKKSEAGKKGSKLQKVEFWVSIDVIKIVNLKTKEVITQKPLHRISYCADDHNDKRLFTFIAKEEECKSHKCFALTTEREAAEFTVTLGQAFELAYKRYLAKGKQESKENREVSDLKKQVEEAKAENAMLKERLTGSDTDSRRSQSINSNGSDNSLQAPVAVTRQDPEPASLLVDFGAAQSQNKPLEEVEAFDPFDKYLSNLAAKRGLGAAEAPVSLPERGAFQSPIQKNPAENPFDTFGEAPSNPFHSFFNNDASADGGEKLSPILSSPSNASSPAAGGTAAFLPPPPSKQSIKAANAMKIKPNKAKTPEQMPDVGDSNGNTEATQNPSQDFFGFGISNDPSVNSLEQSLGTGLQFDSFNFDPLQ